MKHKIFSRLLPSLAIVVVATGTELPALAQKSYPTLTGKFVGAPEVSGATVLPGGTLFLVLDDPLESDKESNVFQLPNATYLFSKYLTGASTDQKQHIGLKQGLKATKVPANMRDRVVDRAVEPDDLEDVAWDRKRNLYLVTSHSATKKGKSKLERQYVIRWPMNVVHRTFEPQASYVDQLLQALPEKDEQGEADEGVKPATERTAAQGGFNIEGAAIAGDGALLLGLRAPTHTAQSNQKGREVYEDAIVLRVDNPQAGPYKPKMQYLNLNGEGIRGLCYDPQLKGCWIAAGISPDLPDSIVPPTWSIWFWPDGKATAQMVMEKKLSASQTPWSNLDNVEAICRLDLKLGSQTVPYLLLVGDAKPDSPFCLLPMPKIQGN